MNKSNITDHESLVRDPETGVIKNKNRAAFIAARNRKMAVVEKKASQEESLSKIESLEQELAEMKAILKKLTNSSNKKAKNG